MEDMDKWISEYLEISFNEYKKIANNRFVYNFLVLWSIYEQKVFNGYCHYDKIIENIIMA